MKQLNKPEVQALIALFIAAILCGLLDH